MVHVFYFFSVPHGVWEEPYAYGALIAVARCEINSRVAGKRRQQIRKTEILTVFRASAKEGSWQKRTLHFVERRVFVFP